MANFEEVGQKFIQHYYTLFDTNQRTQLASLYQDTSMLSFEGNKFQGRNAIGEKLSSLPFQTVKHEIVTMDCQPAPGNGVLVFVCGNLAVDNEANAIKFSQCFNLQPIPNSPGGFYVYNDVFRLNYG